MSYRVEAIEDVVASIHRLRGTSGAENSEKNRLFGMLLGLLNGQIRYVIQLYGLEEQREDARHICIDAIHNALADHACTGGSFAPLISIHLRQGVYALSLFQSEPMAA